MQVIWFLGCSKVPSILANIEAGQTAHIGNVAREFWKGDANHSCKAVDVNTKTLCSLEKKVSVGRPRYQNYFVPWQVTHIRLKLYLSWRVGLPLVHLPSSIFLYDLLVRVACLVAPACIWCPDKAISDILKLRAAQCSIQVSLFGHMIEHMTQCMTRISAAHATSFGQPLGQEWAAAATLQIR